MNQQLLLLLWGAIDRWSSSSVVLLFVTRGAFSVYDQHADGVWPRSFRHVVLHHAYRATNQRERSSSSSLSLDAFIKEAQLGGGAGRRRRKCQEIYQLFNIERRWIDEGPR